MVLRWPPTGAMAMNIPTIDELQKWSVGETHVNHWIHEDGLSIRTTHDRLTNEYGYTVHIAATDGWVVEIYPVEDWPISLPNGYGDVHRWYPDSTAEAKRMTLGLMLAVALAKGKS